MKINLILISLLCFSTCFGQSAENPNLILDTRTGILRELRLRPEDVPASIYLSEEWKPANVFLKSGAEANNLSVRFDLKNNTLEVKTNEGVKVAISDQLKRFELFPSSGKQSYVNGELLPAGKSVIGIVEELVRGKFSLYAKPYLEKIPASYNVAMDVGDRSDKYVTKEALLLISDNEVVDITKAGKKILVHFDDKKEDIEKYVKENKFSYKDKNDLVRIVSKFNEFKSSE